MTSLKQRLVQIEAELKDLRRKLGLAIGAAVVFGGIAILACQPAGTTPDPTPTPTPEVAKEAAPPEIRLATADGSRTLLLTPDGLVLSNNGKARVEIRADNVSTNLTLRDPSGRRRVSALATDGPVAISILAQNEKDLAVLAGSENDPIARLELFGAGNDPRAALSVARDGKGALTVVSTAASSSTPTPRATPTPSPTATPTPL